MTKFFVAMLGVSFLLLSGCADKNPLGETQTVEWYKAHSDERKAMVELCKNNPGEYMAMPNCVNAHQANESAVWEKKGGFKAPKPMTFDKK